MAIEFEEVRFAQYLDILLIIIGLCQFKYLIRHLSKDFTKSAFTFNFVLKMVTMPLLQENALTVLLLQVYYACRYKYWYIFNFNSVGNLTWNLKKDTHHPSLTGKQAGSDPVTNSAATLTKATQQNFPQI